jgi:hypothetical protein
MQYFFTNEYFVLHEREEETITREKEKNRDQLKFLFALMSECISLCMTVLVVHQADT